MMEPRLPPKVPKDGPGPRGLPDCYYTSRVLNSTFRYQKFVKKLRATEEEQRKGAANELKSLKDRQTSDFFIRCDRRSLINNVARRVDLCMESYQQDLAMKRNELKELFSQEEKLNIHKFVEQAQAGADALWQDKLDRLAYLQEKRRKEHEEKYKDTPLSKAAHVLPCIYKIRAKEAQDIQLYQMKEKQARKMAEIEMDHMWHALAMKESDALAARMEQDAIERHRRDMECKKYSDMQLEQLAKDRERERERLKREQLALKAKFDEDDRKEREAQEKLSEKRKQAGIDIKDMVEKRRQVVAKQEAEVKLINDTWSSLTGEGLADEKAKLELRRRKERELDICNRKMIELKTKLGEIEKCDDVLIEQEAKARQEKMDKSRCEYLAWAQKTNADVRKAMVDQIKDRQEAKEVLKQKLAEQDEYQSQVFTQMEKLVANKDLEDAMARKQRQRDLLKQIEYNKLLKERALQEERDQIKKCQLAAQEYESEIARMLSRPFYSDEVHPFMKQMAKGLKMTPKCPCSKPDYCEICK